VPQILIRTVTFIEFKKYVDNTETKLSHYKQFKPCKGLTLSVFLISLAEDQDQRINVLLLDQRPDPK